MSYHSLTLYAPAVYAASLNAPTGTRLILAILFERTKAGKPFTPSQRRLGELLHRSARTVRRWIAVGVKRGWIRVIRRGKKQTNVYRLSAALWRRLVGRQPSKLPQTVQASLFRIGASIGLGAKYMGRRGVTTPR